jgi:hypothetical protein
MIISSSEERQSELDKLLDTIDKSLDRDLAREKARMVEIFNNQIALSRQYARQGSTEMAWVHRNIAESIARYLDVWK